MKALRAYATRDPSGTLSILTLLAAPVAALAGHPEFAPVLIALAAAVLGLRTQVTPTDKALKAQTAVAIDVANNLTAETAGATGEITGAAARVIDDALGKVAG